VIKIYHFVDINSTHYGLSLLSKV